MSVPTISVVVPFFERESSIGACVESLLASREELDEPVELLFVDNVSPDRSAEIVAGYPEVELLREETAGAYAARNTAILRARAPLVAFTDADCTVAPDWLCSIREGMEDPGVGALVGRVLYPPAASAGLRLLGAWENAKASWVLERGTANQAFAYANNMAVRTSVFDEIGPFREWRRAADTELVHRLAHERPELQVRYRASMQVVHGEFLRFRDRAHRLALYTETNAQVPTFSELSFGQRCAVLLHLLRGSA